MNENTINSKFQLINRLMSNIVVKQEKRANEFETEEMYRSYMKYKMVVEGSSTLDGYTGFSVADLAVGLPHLSLEVLTLLSEGQIAWSEMVKGGFISQEMYEYYYGIMVDKEKDSYVEQNNYYRMLLGLPPIEMKPEDFIYVFDDVPIQYVTDRQLFTLKDTGRMDTLIREYPTHEYLNYIGKDISIIDARDAEEFGVLWVADTPESSLYRELFNRERKVFMQTYHSEYLNKASDFNEMYELTTLKMRAIVYYIIMTASPQLDKTTFTKEESEVLFRENGLSFPKNMPSVYRDSVSFVLNYLISFKGTNYSVDYIASHLFSGIRLYKYFIRKRHKKDLTYPIPEDAKPEDIYDVDFILRPFNSTNPWDSKGSSEDDIILSYDEVVLLDPKWQDTQQLKDFVFSSEFSYVNSKYIALDNIIDINELTTSISVMMRLIVEYKQAWSTIKVRYSGTRVTHNFFDLWIYYIALFTGLVNRRRVPIPDSVERIKKLLGFIMPEDIFRIQVYWHWFMEQKPFGTMLDDFPREITTADSFYEMLIKVDKSIGLAFFLDEVMQYARNFPEVKIILEVYRAIRVVNTIPENFETEITKKLPTIDGIPFDKYLEGADLILYRQFTKFFESDSDEALVLELDNMSQFLIELLQTTQDDRYQLDHILSALNDFNMLGGGISRYLLYLIKMFKSYTADFLNEHAMLEFNEKYSYQLNIEQVDTEGECIRPDRWNMSHNDFIEKEVSGEVINGEYREYFDTQHSPDTVYIETPNGDVCISR